MDFKYQILAVIISLVGLITVLELIRQRRIQDVLWLPWLGIALAPAVVGLWITPWASLARWLGILYEPVLLVVLACVLSFAMLLYLSIVVSELIRKNLRLAQEIALLEHRVSELRAAVSPSDRQ